MSSVIRAMRDELHWGPNISNIGIIATTTRTRMTSRTGLQITDIKTYGLMRETVPLTRLSAWDTD